MGTKEFINSLIQYALDKELICPGDENWAYNRILDVLHLDAAEGIGEDLRGLSLPEILGALTETAVEAGICDDGSTARDLFDTKLMGVLTPAPHEVRKKFSDLYEKSPKDATDWFYRFCGDTNYIRRDRIAKDMKWDYNGKYGTLEITINLSKPEKDPKAIAAAKNAPQTGYPLCQLCAENEGYSGRIDHPARQNHRPIPITINSSPWYFQYSPYVYYNEHCIVFNSEHIPMKIDEAAFKKLFSFVEQFPHYILGSNADLPIVGGSILSHDHFQGGCHEFPMAKAGIERKISFKGFEDIKAGIVQWPMSVIRLSSPDTARIIELATKILSTWRRYTDKDAFIFAETNGEPHNTITPIARKRGNSFELDLVLRNNITTEEHPLGVYHPHSSLHHIKKENIGLIEVMGLAILPGRLKKELEGLKESVLSGKDISEDAELGKHAEWLEGLKAKYTFSKDNTDDILRTEVGAVFEQVLEDAGVYKCTVAGRAAFMRFIESV
ncbi:MAG: UDP-glucose--hexose-1-phosphate uridylyltransferase [Eubacteriales bacterium]|nr:UDP-glucose--hexose-1-phosphate uridylyltransferase [Eubacteriales bacterium]